MTVPTVLASTWNGGLYAVTGQTVHQELRAQSTRGVTSDGRNGALFIADGHSLCARAQDGTIATLATSAIDLACCLAADGVIYVGTGDARLLRSTMGGELEAVHGFGKVPGRETWFAGSALVNGRRMGPPLGVRSMTVTADGSAVLVNVHVGGIPRSTDGGATWQPTVDIHHDVHEVRAHPTRANIVAAAAADGLHLSRDAGATWTRDIAGLHASYCSAVAFLGDDILVAASADHFASEGAVYRRGIDNDPVLVPIGSGLPPRTNGIVDTGCIAVRDSVVAVADRSGNLYVSVDAGLSWECAANVVPAVSSLFVA